MTERAAPDIAGRHRAAVVVGTDSAATRQALDPTAWLVLEELVITGGEVRGSTVVVATSVRELAGRLGLSKDTVASALRRLASADVVRRQVDRDGGSGRFSHSRYLVELTHTGLRFATPSFEAPWGPPAVATVEPGHLQPAAARVGRRAQPHPRRRSVGNDAQLSLLDSDQTSDQAPDDNAPIDHDQPHATPNIPTQAPPPSTTTPTTDDITRTTDDITPTTPKEAARTTNTIATLPGLVPSRVTEPGPGADASKWWWGDR
ncbi:MAG: helix-turn-helix domain-containing protein [Acidimicrobiales bacterium]